MVKKLVAGQPFQPISVRNIHGVDVAVPDHGAKRIHLQFRRFAGCPVCNLHLQEFLRRYLEIAAAGIREVVVFHSEDRELLPYQGRFPMDVIGDPEKKLYRRYGVETSIWAILNPGAWGASLTGNLAKDKPALGGMPNGGLLGLPADFLIAPDGTIEAVHYGKHAYDQWSVDEVLSLAAAACARA